jgi:hypothetical protein
MTPAEPPHRPESYKCHACRALVDLKGGPAPKGSWVKSPGYLQEPELFFVCEECRRRDVGAIPDPREFRCLRCRTLVSIRSDPDAQRRLQLDPDALIQETAGRVDYAAVCRECEETFQARIAERDRLRETASFGLACVPHQMSHIRELVAYHRRHDRMSLEEAITLSVDIEMAVADCARFEAFMTWLHQRDWAETERRIREERKAA